MSNFTQAATLLRTEIPLQHTWTFWFDKNAPATSESEYAANLVPLHSVSTVQDFWRAYNNITGPDELLNRNSLYFMKQGIRPMWEDPKNERGGCLAFRVNKSETATVWRELLMLLIGEQLDGYISPADEICGLSVGARWNTDIVQIWNARADMFKMEPVLKQLGETLKDTELQSCYYKAHKEHHAFSKK
ncbi:translation initiation factor eIF 4e-like domain-containing protein [Thamnocephalis sphaerospora]|uniref:Translation initiation factor eIF 4e-like domain-containing protein n=1 Tax=Thamnocephalis sphaerospora TaxID=78915 RepID=A0A4P9XTF7_9FUNG|nr:translation initiation factor eIF 4e-like domain-containing protein [Thamnocephalis sphaerospora]|eukprot:RKP09447.1 translation initiation factor eIF 4e-like domain-containing protein [Thamnocephalis sphaerospora]